MLKSFVSQKLKYGVCFRQRLRRIKAYYELSDNEIEDYEAIKINQLVKNAYSRSPFYRDLYDKYGVNISQVQNRSDLVNLPSISKSDIRNCVNDIFIGNFLKHKAYTSGTSGTPLQVYYSMDCVINEASYNEIFRNNAGHFYGDRTISLRGALDNTKREYFDKFNNILYLSSYHLSPQNAEWYSKKINEFKPKTILAYPSSLEALSGILKEKGCIVNIPLAFTSSESLYSHQQQFIENQLNCRIFDRYGNAERTISLVQHEHKGGYYFPKLYSVNEFIELGKTYTTNLINPQFPLIRYLVEDHIEIDRSELNKVKSIGGRIDDCIHTEDGLRIGSAAMSLAIKKVPNILMTQIQQDNFQEITVKVVCANKFSNSDMTFLKSELRNRVGDSLKINVKTVTESQIEKTKANKYKLIINNLDF